MTQKSVLVTEEKNALDTRQPQKKTYKKPEFRSEKVVEYLALACGKHPGARSAMPFPSTGPLVQILQMTL
jgi:hypothetical protein